MSKIIVSCPNCNQPIRIPSNGNIKFNCPNCKEELVHNSNNILDATDVESNDEEFKPSNLRIFFHVIIGAFIGAPIGAGLVGAISAIIGSFKGYYDHFWETLDPFKLIEILIKSIRYIGEGAAELSQDWIPYGAKFGPWVVGFFGLVLSFSKWDRNENKEKSTNNG